MAAGVTVNALWIRDETFFGDSSLGDTIDALDYGNTNVIGGTGSFQQLVGGFADFGPAIETKIAREITGTPEPSALLLLGLGLAGVGFLRKRR